ncbi:hypothetical protein IGI04_018142, partial [Brassica rapa subsp. trilocularis]
NIALNLSSTHFSLSRESPSVVRRLSSLFRSAVFRSDPPSPFRFAVYSPSLSSRSTVSVLNRRLRPDSSSSSRSTKQSRSRLKTSNIAESVSFSSDKKYDITQVKAPPQLQKTMC